VRLSEKNRTHANKADTEHAVDDTLHTLALPCYRTRGHISGALNKRNAEKDRQECFRESARLAY
jgi:hypothetical protein